MSKTATEPAIRKGDGAVAAGPVCLDDLLARGGILYGVPVLSVRIETVDGRSQRLSLRVDEDEATNLTEMQSAVVTVVDQIPTGHVRTTYEIARAAGYSDSGKLRSFVKSLAIAGRLRRVHRGWQKT
jgi:hypothetical protein